VNLLPPERKTVTAKLLAKFSGILPHQVSVKRLPSLPFTGGTLQEILEGVLESHPEIQKDIQDALQIFRLHGAPGKFLYHPIKYL
jgi:hypothetical protein